MKQFTRINPTSGRDKDANRSESTVPQAGECGTLNIQAGRQQPATFCTSTGR